MEQKLSSKQLYHYLNDLKETIQNVDLSPLSNVIFLDSHSFYCYLAKLRCGMKNTVEDILTKIESCIPFALTDDSFSLFLSACEQKEAEKMEALRHGFMESCKTDFLMMLFGISDQKQWEDIVNTCENLRQKTRPV